MKKWLCKLGFHKWIRRDVGLGEQLPTLPYHPPPRSFIGPGLLVCERCGYWDVEEM